MPKNVFTFLAAKPIMAKVVKRRARFEGCIDRTG
jgi:hypothetical protein